MGPEKKNSERPTVFPAKKIPSCTTMLTTRIGAALLPLRRIGIATRNDGYRTRLPPRPVLMERRAEAHVAQAREPS